ncbi:hypothetical protein BGX27_003202, partial [Mortierella sp. AM989]
DTHQKYLQVLNQKTEWSVNGADLLAFFEVFKMHQISEGEIYSLSYDCICDLTSQGEVFKALELDERKIVTADKPRFQDFDELDQIMGTLFQSELVAPTFEEVLDRVRSMDQKDYLVQYVTYVLSSIAARFDKKEPRNSAAVEAADQLHKVDAVLKVDGCQIVIVEASASHVVSKDEELEDHYRLSQDMWSSWMNSLDVIVEDGKDPG